LRAASVREDASLLAEAERWSSSALAEARRPEAFERGLAPAERGRPRRDSIFFGTPGLHLTAALLRWAQGGSGLESSVARLEAHGPGPDAPLELLQGVAGHLAAATCLARETGLPAARALARRWARRLLAEPLVPEAAARGAAPDLGFAHGLGGVYFALLRWAEACGETLPPEIEMELGRLAGLGRRASRPGWCGGNAGAALLWAKAFELFRAPAFLNAARSSAESSLAGGASLGSVCCGLGGSAYAALALARVDGGRPWRARALAAGRRAIELRRATQWPYGLLKGDAGLVCLGLDLISEDVAGFPLVEG
jgi:eukaryotic-like serine/threonine-protein kinase